MDAQQQIDTFIDFFNREYIEEILEASRLGTDCITFDFNNLSQFNLDLSDDLLEEPEEVIRAAGIAIEQFDCPGSNKFQILIKNLPPSCKCSIAAKRSSNFDKLLTFEGVIRAKTPVLSNVRRSRFECPSCGNIIPVIQTGEKFNQPSRCGCGRKGKFKYLEQYEELTDVQRLSLEELPENVKGHGQPQKLKVELIGKLVDPKFEPKFNPGAKVLINGILTKLPVKLKSGAQSTDYDFLLRAVYMENIDSNEIDVTLSNKDRKEIEAIAKDPNYLKILKKSFAPSIEGHDKIKEGILAQIAGGVRRIRGDGHVERGDIHILLIGDPGAGKSQILRRVSTIIPSAREANGKGATGAGLAASVQKDEFLGGWTFQAGTLVLAHKTLAIIDEFDKMGKEDREYLHEILEQQTVTLSKAGVQAKLKAESSLLAAANPKFGRFDPYANTLAEQIDLPPTLIDRFELIFPIRDKRDSVRDEKIARKMLDFSIDEDSTPQLDTVLLAKYLSYAKTFKPILTDQCKEKLLDYYLKIRGNYSSDNDLKNVPLSARQLASLMNLTKAFAKLRLSHNANVGDAQRAIDILDYCLKQIAFDHETGTVDIDRISSNISGSQRNNLTLIKKIIRNLVDKIGNNIPLQDIVDEADKENISEDKLEEAINLLKKNGVIHEPKRGFIQEIR